MLKQNNHEAQTEQRLSSSKTYFPRRASLPKNLAHLKVKAFKFKVNLIGYAPLNTNFLETIKVITMTHAIEMRIGKRPRMTYVTSKNTIRLRNISMLIDRAKNLTILPERLKVTLA